jgi:hypothetical protein
MYFQAGSKGKILTLQIRIEDQNEEKMKKEKNSVAVDLIGKLLPPDDAGEKGKSGSSKVINLASGDTHVGIYPW